MYATMLPHMKWIFNFKTKVQKRVLAQALQKKMHKVGAKKREFGTCIGIRQVTPAQRKLFECKNEYIGMYAIGKIWLTKKIEFNIPLWFFYTDMWLESLPAASSSSQHWAKIQKNAI